MNSWSYNQLTGCKGTLEKCLVFFFYICFNNVEIFWYYDTQHDVTKHASGFLFGFHHPSQKDEGNQPNTQSHGSLQSPKISVHYLE